MSISNTLVQSPLHLKIYGDFGDLQVEVEDQTVVLDPGDDSGDVPTIVLPGKRLGGQGPDLLPAVWQVRNGTDEDIDVKFVSGSGAVLMTNAVRQNRKPNSVTPFIALVTVFQTGHHDYEISARRSGTSDWEQIDPQIVVTEPPSIRPLGTIFWSTTAGFFLYLVLRLLFPGLLP